MRAQDAPVSSVMTRGPSSSWTACRTAAGVYRVGRACPLAPGEAAEELLSWSPRGLPHGSCGVGDLER